MSGGPEREGVKLLFSRDIATKRGIDVSTARRWLTALERKHGATVVGRIGAKLYTTEAALQQIAPKWRGPDGDFAQRLKDCEETIDQLTREARQMMQEIRTLKSARRPDAAHNRA